MRFGRLSLVLAPILLIACNAGGGHAADAEQAGDPAPATSSPLAAGAPMTLGVSTLFSQGWPERHWALLEGLAVHHVRESISWKAIESAPGIYRFDAKNSGHVERICRASRKVTLVLLPRHPLYDAGQAVSSAEGQAAFARYIVTLGERFGTCLAAVEIGNEVNGAAAGAGPAADRALAHARLLQAVAPAIKARLPELILLGGSSNAIGTGFLEDVFAGGGLAALDGVAVHPYRPDPANVDWELDRLTAAMRRHGGEKPIWATEFGTDSADAAPGPAYFAKMATLMSAAGVSHADWFALVDEPRFPHFGLFTAQGQPKPVADTFALFARNVLPRGRAQRLSGGEGGLFHYRFGPEMQIVWGEGRSLTASGPLQFRDLAGRPIAPPAALSDTPVLAEGSGELGFGPANLLADSLYDYGREQWSYLGWRGDDAALSLAPVDWRFTTFIGHAALKPAAINQTGLLPAGRNARAITLALRYAAAEAGQVHVSACLFNRVAGVPAGRFELRQGDAIVKEAALPDAPLRFSVPLALRRNEIVELRFVPPGTEKAGTARYRLRVTRGAADPAPCPAGGEPGA